MTLATLQPSAAASFAYWGDRAGWHIAASVHRESDYVDRSNARVITAALAEAHPADTAVERVSHWAVGWVDYTLVRPGSAAYDAALVFHARLADYPVLDEIDASAEEWAENHPNGAARGAYCYAESGAECHQTDSHGRIVQPRDAAGRFTR